MLLVAVTWDLRESRIPNLLIYLGLIAGASYRILSLEIQEEASFLVSLLWPILLLYPFFYIKAIGAGDIKLLCVLSTFLSAKDELWLIFFSFIFGAGFSCYRIITHREALKRLLSVGKYVEQCILQKKILKYSTLKKSNSYVRFSVFILAAFLLLTLKKIF